MTYRETTGGSFHLRYDDRDEADVERVVAQLHYSSDRLERRFPNSPGQLAIVIHGVSTQLEAAMPWLFIRRRLTAPAGRRYLVGWVGERELHVLSPRLLAARAANVQGSLEHLMLAPSALLARRYISANHPGMPPPYGPASFAKSLRWAWLLEGAAQYFSGQVAHLRPAVARRLREGRAPSFPPSRRDAPLLGGTVFDLLAREHGERACIDLACGPHRSGATAALEQAFGRSLPACGDIWRAHLLRLAEGPPQTRRF